MIPDIETAKQASEPLEEDARNIKGLVDNTKIANHEDLKTMVAWTAEIKTKHTEVDDVRKSFVEPLRKVVEDINTFFKPALESLKDAETKIKRKISDYTTSQLEQRDKLLESIDIELSDGEKSEAIEKADKLQPPKISGLAIRETWSGKFSDASETLKWAVENQRYDLFHLNEKALKALTKSLGRDPKIPGWTAYVNRSVAITPSKV